MPFRTASGKLLYRVGDVIISTNNQNPSEWYGGTWELFAPGRTLVCIDTSQAEFDSIKKIGGSKYMQNHTHTASSGSGGVHTHGGTAVRANLVGSLKAYIYNSFGASGIVSQEKDALTKNGGSSGNTWGGSTYSINASHYHTLSIDESGAHTHSVSVANSGSGNAQNLQPFIVVYMWIRTA